MTIPRYAFSVEEAGEALGCSGDHIRKLINVGEIRAVSITGRVLVPRVELERMCGMEPSLPERVTSDDVVRVMAEVVSERLRAEHAPPA